MTLRWSRQGPEEGTTARAIDLGIAFVAVGFTGLLLAYAYLRLQNPRWPPPDIAEPRLGGTLVTTAFLLFGWVAMYSASKLDPDDSMVFRPLTGAAVVGGFAVFLQWRHIRWLDTGSTVHAYGSIFSVMAGYIIGVASVAVTMAAIASCWQFRRLFTDARHLALAHFVRFWTAAVAIWLAGFAILFLGPRVL